MTVEEIAVRQEVRQLLNEAGVNKNAMKEIVRQVINEELTKAVKQVMCEMGLKDYIYSTAKNNLQDEIRKELRASIDSRVNSLFNRIKIDVGIKNIAGNEVTGSNELNFPIYCLSLPHSSTLRAKK